ncbi:hypothetical protein BJ508DRAFT_311125 [Ascobolus immersus RN42]|uniref:Uncharacterized protein n=1 Tax=Ascobolus immersus RN42 TaxID=1160509 RepID=A0A3N4HSX6_ASCIM|nr:hypothetical protein BJ508DRAFT_311125 [Ascobolus immersus RN42]
MNFFPSFGSQNGDAKYRSKETDDLRIRIKQLTEEISEQLNYERLTRVSDNRAWVNQVGLLTAFAERQAKEDAAFKRELLASMEGMRKEMAGMAGLKHLENDVKVLQEKMAKMECRFCGCGTNKEGEPDENGSSQQEQSLTDGEMGTIMPDQIFISAATEGQRVLTKPPSEPVTDLVDISPVISAMNKNLQMVIAKMNALPQRVQVLMQQTIIDLSQKLDVCTSSLDKATQMIENLTTANSHNNKAYEKMLVGIDKLVAASEGAVHFLDKWHMKWVVLIITLMSAVCFLDMVVRAWIFDLIIPKTRRHQGKHSKVDTSGSSSVPPNTTVESARNQLLMKMLCAKEEKVFQLEARIHESSISKTAAGETPVPRLVDEAASSSRYTLGTHQLSTPYHMVDPKELRRVVAKPTQGDSEFLRASGL